MAYPRIIVVFSIRRVLMPDLAQRSDPEDLRRFAGDFCSFATCFGKAYGDSLFAAFDLLARLARFKGALLHFMDGPFYRLRSFWPVFSAA
jgi:hypothetical protein